MPASLLRDESPSHDCETWYERSFDALYPIVYAHRTVAAAAPEATFAAAKTGIGPDDTVLDLCCGNGRHLVHIAGHTPKAIGLDFSAHLIQLAQESLRDRAAVLRGDMRALPFAPVFDVVLNFFTSFGYFMEPDDNARVLRQIAAVLKPGGRFFMDYLNPAQVRATLVPESTRDQDGFTIQETRWIDEARGRVNKTTVVTRGEELITRSSESVQLYDCETLCTMLATAGLRVDQVSGGYDDAAYDTTQPRMILIGTRV
jgi:SAM-dependent methyltransferase